MRNLFAIILIVSGCGCSLDTSEIDLTGKWRYLDQDEQYYELWFDEEYVLDINEVSYSIDYYRYWTNDDSLFFSSLNRNEIDPIYSFQIKIKEEGLFLKNDFISIKANQFEEKARIDTSRPFREKVYSEFGSRLRDR